VKAGIQVWREAEKVSFMAAYSMQEKQEGRQGVGSRRGPGWL